MTKKFDVKALREKVLATDDIQHDESYIEEWDVTLPIRTISSANLEEIIKYRDDRIRFATLAVSYGCVTEDDEQVFKETDLAKVAQEKYFGVIQRIAERALELSGFSDKEVDEA